MSKAPNSCCDGARENRVLIAREPCPIGNSMGKFLSLKHPRTGKAMHYLYNGEVLQELHSFKQAVGSWFLGDYVCEDGRMFTATPVDPVFILLPIFEEARMKKGEDPGKFRQFEDIIFVPGYPGYGSLSSLAAKSMEIVCDLKDVGSSKFFRLNDSKVLKWLCYKVNRLKLTLPTLDKNYAVQDEKPILDLAVSIVGEYLKDEHWMKLLRNELKLNSVETSSDHVKNMEAATPVDASVALSEKNGEEKRRLKRSTRESKKAKVEKDSHNIKDMFFKASRSRN